MRRRILDTGWSGVSQLSGFATSLVVLVVLTRELGIEEFGIYSGATALASILLGLATFGASDLMLHSLNRAEPVTERAAFGRAIATAAAASAVCLVALFLVRPVVLESVPARFLLPLAASEFATYTVLTVHVRLLHHARRFAVAALVSITSAVGKAAAIAWAAWHHGWTPLGTASGDRFEQLVQVSQWLLMSSLAVFAVTTVLLARLFGGLPHLSLATSGSEYRRGISLALGQTSLSVNSGADQTLLLRAGLERDTGLYGIGVRAVQYSLLPMSAFFATSYPEYFRRGAEGFASITSFARQIARPAVIYGVGVGLLLVVASRAVGTALGNEYSDSGTIVAVMAGFPLLRIVQSILGDVLTGLGHFALRSAALIVTATFNVLVNLWAIPRFGWHGAAATTYVTEIGFAVLLWVAIRWVGRTEPDRPR